MPIKEYVLMDIYKKERRDFYIGGGYIGGGFFICWLVGWLIS